MNQINFISFTPSGDCFSASVSMESLINFNEDIENKTKEGVKVYASIILEIRNRLDFRKTILKNNQRIPARLMWEIGDLVFRLNLLLSELGFQLDDTYLHLTRDLGVKRKWLEKVVILRRYVENIDSIPENQNWGYFEKSTKKKAISLIKSKLI